MTDFRIENINIEAEERIITPEYLKSLYPLTEKCIETVSRGQSTIKNILTGNDPRILMVVGPCSIHDVKAAKEYALKLKQLSNNVSDVLYIAMRVYFEKPRTTTGWQGFINDPLLDNSNQLEHGLKCSRELLTFIAEAGLPAAGEALDIVTPQYIQDLISWTAIGARTTESQSHRNMASGLSSTVGFKNGTDGNIDIAINALTAVKSGHNFVSINPQGQVSLIKTKGNPFSHIILRGGKHPNYKEECIAQACEKLSAEGFIPRIMVDCSHANSGKKADNQKTVLQHIGEQIKNGNNSIFGVMIESNLFPGSQPIPENKTHLKYGVSVTDACLGWEDTSDAIFKFYNQIKNTIQKRG